MIKCEKLGKGAYKVNIIGDGDTITNEYIALTEYLTKNIPSVIVAATEDISKKLEDL